MLIVQKKKIKIFPFLVPTLKVKCFQVSLSFHFSKVIQKPFDHQMIDWKLYFYFDKVISSFSISIVSLWLTLAQFDKPLIKDTVHTMVHKCFSIILHVLKYSNYHSHTSIPKPSQPLGLDMIWNLQLYRIEHL